MYSTIDSRFHFGVDREIILVTVRVDMSKRACDMRVKIRICVRVRVIFKVACSNVRHHLIQMR